MTLEVHTTVSTQPRFPVGALAPVMSTMFAKVVALFQVGNKYFKKNATL